MYKFLKYFGVLFVILFLSLLILSSAEILGLAVLYGQVNLGKANLDRALVLGQQGKFSQAEATARAAQINFNDSLDQLGQIKSRRLINRLPPAVSQLNDLESLLISGQFLSRAVYGGASFGRNLETALGDKNLKFSQLSQADKQKILSKLYQSAPELNGVKADLDLAVFNLDQINPVGVLFFWRDKIIETEKQINQARLILEKAVPLSQLLPVIAGYPKQAEYLVLFQNDSRLGPSGGRLDSYGILRVESGEIVSFDTHNVSALDSLVRDRNNQLPPEPIKKYLMPGGWYLRDANWSPDWPTAAKTIASFYKHESNFNPAAEKVSRLDGVIVLTPKLMTDLLDVIGPIVVDGKKYDSTNYQYFFQPAKEPGDLAFNRAEIGEIAKTLKFKALDSSPTQGARIINVIVNNLSQKNLLLYFIDKQLENIALDNDWGGEVKSTDGDYVMVVDANLGTANIDALIRRSVGYRVDQGINGLFSELTINYSAAGKASLNTEIYKTYTRVYVPLGSKLIKVTGLDLNQIEVASDLGKTQFGFYLTIEPGNIKNLIIRYQLPPLIASAKSYSLYIQKQPGRSVNEMTVDLGFLNEIKSYNPVSLYMLKASPTRMRWEGDLSIDRSFEVRF